MPQEGATTTTAKKLARSLTTQAVRDGGMERLGVLGLGARMDAGGDLPPGFRFHPTDEELVTYYLLRKAVDGSFCGRAIAEIDLNKCEPWELPDKAKMGEKEWYFYTLRDRKYPTGLRTNRATASGYWKATGKDREIRTGRSGALVGMKKTLVFYRGRAPKGQKTPWVMHEYRLEGSYSYHCLPTSSSRDEWVIVRVFQKPGEAPSSRKNRLCLSSTRGGDASGFSDSTSASVAGEGGCASASSAPRPLLLDSPAFALARVAADGASSCYGGANAKDAANVVTGLELVPCFSTTAPMDAALGMGQYNPVSLAFEPPAALFPNLRSLHENLQLPMLLSGTGSLSGAGASALSGGLSWPAGVDVKVEGAIGRAPPQMAVGPGQLDGAFAWGF
ncbi:hypothetical protein ACP4OV_001448 [Aristida adscensionis]